MKEVMNESKERGKKMKKIQKKIRCMINILIAASLLLACKAPDNKLERGEAFIQSEFYSAYDQEKDEATIKAQRLSYLTEEAYEDYLSNYFGSMYPVLLKGYEPEEVNLHKIKCKEIVRNDDGTEAYIFEVKYSLSPPKRKKIEMVDYFRLTIDEKMQITEAIIMNTSDIVKKLILGVKVH